MSTFQSSRSLRTATIFFILLDLLLSDFNPRGPCGPRLPVLPIQFWSYAISILAVLADRDMGQDGTGEGSTVFQSSRSLRTATIIVVLPAPGKPFQSSRSLRTATRSAELSTATTRISILAVLADRDTDRTFPSSALTIDFNPRGPCGPRPSVLRNHAVEAHISILAVLADRDSTQTTHLKLDLRISILAVLADRDSVLKGCLQI